jgi:hypothetical protein
MKLMAKLDGAGKVTVFGQIKSSPCPPKNLPFTSPKTQSLFIFPLYDDQIREQT